MMKRKPFAIKDVHLGMGKQGQKEEMEKVERKGEVNNEGEKRKLENRRMG